MKAKDIAAFLTVFALAAGIAITAITAWLGNPIAGILGLTSVVLWDLRDYFKFRASLEALAKRQEEKEKKPVTSGRRFRQAAMALRLLLFVGAAIATGFYAAELTDLSKLNEIKSNHDLFWFGAASTSAQAAASLACAYGVIAVFGRIADWVVKNKEAIDLSDLADLIG